MSILSILKAAMPRTTPLTELGLSGMRADYESGAPTGVSFEDITGMEQFLIGVKTHTGQIVTPEKAKRCAAVLAIMRGLSEDVSCLPIHILQHTKNGDERVIDHFIDPLLNQEPNDVMTALEMREHMMWELMTWGAFYNLKNEDPDSPGDLVSLWPLQAGYVTRRWRELVWVFTDPITGISGQFSPDLVWRGTIMAGNGLDGVAITLLCREAIGLLLAAEEQGARLFAQGVQTDFVLETPDTMDEPEQKRLREGFMRKYSGSRNAFIPLILEGGLKANKLGLTAQESQYIESRGFQIADIARAFRYPEVLLGSTGKSSRSATYASAEQFFQSYTKHTLAPWATRIEQTAHRDLLDTREKKKYFFRHDFDGLLRADTAGRYASYATGIATGFMSPADVRRKENMQYVPGLDYYTRPLNTTATAGGDATTVKPTDVSGSADEDHFGKDSLVSSHGALALQNGAKELYFPAQSLAEAMNADLARRVALFLVRKEQKALSTNQAPDAFYSHFGRFVEDITGAELSAVLSYVAMRKSAKDPFSAEAQEAAITALISLCKKDNQ